MAKSANLYVRIEPDVKKEAEAILSELGIPASNAINIFYKQIILQGGLPFDVKLPSRPINVDEITQNLLNEEIQKGFDDVANGRVKSAAEVFSNTRKKYNL